MAGRAAFLVEGVEVTDWELQAGLSQLFYVPIWKAHDPLTASTTCLLLAQRKRKRRQPWLSQNTLHSPTKQRCVLLLVYKVNIPNGLFFMNTGARLKDH